MDTVAWFVWRSGSCSVELTVDSFIANRFLAGPFALFFDAIILSDDPIYIDFNRAVYVYFSNDFFDHLFDYLDWLFDEDLSDDFNGSVNKYLSNNFYWFLDLSNDLPDHFDWHLDWHLLHNLHYPLYRYFSDNLSCDFSDDLNFDLLDNLSDNFAIDWSINIDNLRFGIDQFLNDMVSEDIFRYDLLDDNWLRYHSFLDDTRNLNNFLDYSVDIFDLGHDLFDNHEDLVVMRLLFGRR